ncbi:MAG: hypothetical protein QXT63_01630 [Thermoplasmata archaeon]
MLVKRHRCKFSRFSRKGVAGFFEEIPALILATIGMSIFFITALMAYSNYMGQQETIKFIDDANAFSKAIRNYKGLVYDADGHPIEGRFDHYKVPNLNVTNVSKDLNVKIKNRHFIVKIEDVSDYDTHYNVTIESSSREGLRRTEVLSTVYIRVTDDESHLARLTTVIWV